MIKISPGKPKQRHVYAVQSGSNGLVKIGCSVHVDKRIKQLMIPEPKIINTWIGGFEDEGWLHDKLSDSRVEKEWFKPEVIEYLESFQGFPERPGRYLTNDFVFCKEN